MARSKLLLEVHLKALRLPTFLREYDKLARQCAAESLDSRSFLQQLCELELLDREQRATERRIKAAKFPVTKSLDTFDFPSLPALNKKLVLELARCEFIDRRENVLALGNSARAKRTSAWRWDWRLVSAAIEHASQQRRHWSMSCRSPR